MDEFFEDMMSPDLSNESLFPSAFVSCTTLKDPPSYDGRHHTLEVITFISYEAFRAFENETNPRSEKYLQFKEHLSQRLIKTVEKVVPGISDHIVQRELGSPITNEYYINSTEGSVYGTAKTFKQTGPFSYKAKTEIEDLYLCGASIMAHGVAGSAYSGVQTAAIILGCRQEDLIKPDPENRVQVFDAEDDSNYPDWLKNKIALKRAKADLNAKKFVKLKA